MVTPVCQQWRYNSLVLIHRYQGFKITVWLLNQMIFHIPSETNWISFLIQKYCQYVLNYEPYLTRTKCPFSIMPSYQCGDNMIITLSNRYEENIHCDAIIIRSISSKFLTTDTPVRGKYGVSLVSSKSCLCSTFVTALLCSILYYISCSNTCNWLYIKAILVQVLNWMP